MKTVGYEMDDLNDAIAETLQNIVRSLVGSPQNVVIEQEHSAHNGAVTFWVRLGNEADVKKVIGRRGETVRSIRIIIAACGRKANRLFAVNVDDEPHQDAEDNEYPKATDR